MIVTAKVSIELKLVTHTNNYCYTIYFCPKGIIPPSNLWPPLINFLPYTEVSGSSIQSSYGETWSQKIPAKEGGGAKYNSS